MQEKLKNYLKDAGLQISNLEVAEKFGNDLGAVLETVLNTQEDVEKLLTYQVPKLGEDGIVSIIDELSDTPYKLKKILLYNNFNDEEINKLVYKLNKVMELLHSEIGSDWTGIYKKLNTETGPALVKLAYKGIASRVEFPLTKEFSKHSTNSTVGLSGKAVLVTNVGKHRQEGKPYYTYDEKIKSELCMPIFSKDKEVIGIINLESLQENFFDEEKIEKAAVACVLLSEKL